MFRKKQPHHRTILISFCNLVTPRPSGLLAYDLLEQTGRWVDITQNGEEVITSTGLTESAGKVYHIYLTAKGFNLVILDARTLAIENICPIPGVVDAHSIYLKDGYLYLVSTGTDEVVRFRLNGTLLGEKELVWSPSGAGHDTHHLNSIHTNAQGELICTGFGPKKGERWSSADDGYIYNLAQSQYIKKGIYHPHSVVGFRRKLYYCESVTSSLQTTQNQLITLDGYTRGLCFLNTQTAVVGTSKGRKTSKSTGLVNNPADPGDDAGKCEIYICNLKTRQIQQRLDCSPYNNEIYDLLYIPTLIG